MNEMAENADALARGKAAAVVIGEQAIERRRTPTCWLNVETFLLEESDISHQRLNRWMTAVVSTMMWLMANVTGHLPESMADITHHN